MQEAQHRIRQKSLPNTVSGRFEHVLTNNISRLVNEVYFEIVKQYRNCGKEEYKRKLVNLLRCVSECFPPPIESCLPLANFILHELEENIPTTTLSAILKTLSTYYECYRRLMLEFKPGDAEPDLPAAFRQDSFMTVLHMVERLESRKVFDELDFVRMEHGCSQSLMVNLYTGGIVKVEASCWDTVALLRDKIGEAVGLSDRNSCMGIFEQTVQYGHVTHEVLLDNKAKVWDVLAIQQRKARIELKKYKKQKSFYLMYGIKYFYPYS
jgi:hypothetical protein